MSSKKILKFLGIITCCFILLLYFIFLICPFFINSFLSKYTKEVSVLVKENTGFDLYLKDVKFLTTPKLTAGLRVDNVEMKLPSGDAFLIFDGFEVKLSLIPLLFHKIEVDKIELDNTKLYLSVKSDGHFLLEDYLVSSNGKKEENANQVSAGLPFGFKLSNYLPNIYLNKLNAEFIDLKTDKKYYIDLSHLHVKDFILNKKIKLNVLGAVFLDGEKHFTYDVKLENYIMPNLDINDLLVSNDDLEAESSKSSQENNVPVTYFNVIDLFEKIHVNGLTANLKADLKTFGKLDDIDYNGTFSVDGLTVAVDGEKLPEGNVVGVLKNKNIKLTTNLYPAQNENISLISNIKTGKKYKYDVTFTANAGINNIFKLINSVAKSFGIKDFETLTAAGVIDSNFYIEGDSKKVTSSGYFKIPNASVEYGLYNLIINEITADVDFSESNVDVENVSFKVQNQPLKLYGTVSSDAVADLYLVADKLLLKALIAASGQLQLLKENDFQSGTLSMEASLKGKLSKPIPAVNLFVDDVKIKNKPADLLFALDNGTLNLTTENNSYEGVLSTTNAKITSPLFSIAAPTAKITVDENDINISNAYLLFENSKIDVSGNVSDYMSKDICIDISASGKLIANDLKKVFPKEFRSFVSAKGALPLSVLISGNDKMQKIDLSLSATPDNYLTILDLDIIKNKPSRIKSTLTFANDSLKISDTSLNSEGNYIATIDGNISNLSKSQNLSINIDVPQVVKMPIPGFRKDSLLAARGNLHLGGTSLNPTLKGQVDVPEINIPEMKFSMENMSANLSGALVNGKATLGRMVSGGIVAENLSSDFSYNLLNGVFYLKNISGNAFSGLVSGNVAYNLMNGKIGIDFKGSGLDAISAIEGAAGIKNALSGILSFNINATLSGATDVEMIRNLKGKMSFEVKDGAFLSIGKLENLLAADNIVKNVVMKTALAAVSTIPVVKSSANFQYIKGSMTFNNGWAENLSIKTSGPSMAYYITGKYNMLNGTANLVILGRLGSDVVGALGPLGELSVDKLTSFIPKFGVLTSSIIKTMTSDPKNENISEIPQLSSGNSQYKDFKVIFNGGLDSDTSVKSFKWLSNPDLSAIDAPSLKEQIQDSAENIKQSIKTNLETAKEQNQKKQEELRQQAQQFKEQTQQTKEDLKNQVQNVKDSVDEIKNLFKF